MTTLIDRYVAATLRSVPDGSRGEIERELRASIGDALDARLSRGEEPHAAEAAVLTELGDPSMLAAAYSGPPRYLIGPNLYHSYVRTLGLVTLLLVPASWSMLLAVWVAGGAEFPSALLTASAGALLVGLLAAFWTTLAYAVVDRSSEARIEMATALGVMPGPWTPDRLPATAALRPLRVNETVEAIVGGSIGIALLLVQRSVSPFSDAQGHPIPIINPDLWSFWMPVALLIAAGWICAEFVMLALGRWSPRIAVAITLLTLASGTTYIYLLASDQLLNGAFFERLGIASWVAQGSILILIAIVLTAIDTGTRIAKLWGAPIGKGPGKPAKRPATHRASSAR